MKDFLEFRTMITTVLIQILFWIGIALTIIWGLVQIIQGIQYSNYGGGVAVLSGLFTLLFGPLFVRVSCELIIVIFRINGTLTEIKHLLDPNKQKAEKDKAGKNDAEHKAA